MKTIKQKYLCGSVEEANAIKAFVNNSPILAEVSMDCGVKEKITLPVQCVALEAFQEFSELPPNLNGESKKVPGKKYTIATFKVPEVSGIVFFN